jgi:hypothetical protein
MRVSMAVAFAQIGIIGFDGQIELKALRLYGLPEDAPAVIYGCPSLPAGTRTLTLETTWDLPSLGLGAEHLFDVTVSGARLGDHVAVSLATSSRFVQGTGQVWTNNTVRVVARNVSGFSVDLPAATASVEVRKRSPPA